MDSLIPHIQSWNRPTGSNGVTGSNHASAPNSYLINICTKFWMSTLPFHLTVGVRLCISTSVSPNLKCFKKTGVTWSSTLGKEVPLGLQIDWPSLLLNLSYPGSVGHRPKPLNYWTHRNPAKFNQRYQYNTIPIYQFVFIFSSCKVVRPHQLWFSGKTLHIVQEHWSCFRFWGLLAEQMFYTYYTTLSHRL